MGAGDVKEFVRKRYGDIATGKACCGEPVAASGDPRVVEAMSRVIGYTDADLAGVPEGANLGLGCGNPVALAALREGQVVLDLGSGAGFDCFLAASRVGAQGRVIGVDMTPEMLAKARENGRKAGYGNVEFRLGEIESLPVADGEVDVVISNCVINLSPDKEGVFREAFRALKPGGTLAISDMVLLGELPEAIRDTVEMYVGCVAGALLRDDYLAAIRAAGFADVTVVDEMPYPVESLIDDPAIVEGVTASAASVKVMAQKPA